MRYRILKTRNALSNNVFIRHFLSGEAAVCDMAYLHELGGNTAGHSRYSCVNVIAVTPDLHTFARKGIVALVSATK